MTMNRRDFLKTQAVAAAAATAGIAIPVVAAPAGQGAGTEIRWDKAPCRFCGTGCSVLVGVQNGKVVATQGDPDAPVNRGLNCIKGYFLSKIMYGADRLTQPLLRMKGGKYDKTGEFTPITWTQAFDIMEQKWKEALKTSGPTSIAMFGSGQWTIWEGYAASKLWKAGFRSNNLTPTPATAWLPPWPASCAPSASTSPWAATTTSRMPMPSCSGVPTWPKCTRCSGPASPTGA